MKNARLNGKPSMPSAWSAQVHDKIKPMLENDAAWEPAYRSLVGAVAAVWITVVVIGVFAWAQFAIPLPTVAPLGNAPAKPTSLQVHGAGAAVATGESR